MIDLSTHRFDALAHDDECVLYRARREEDGSEVLVLAPAVQYPRPEVLKRLEHEYSLRRSLIGSGLLGLWRCIAARDE
jgi:hypothetical protein